jgi:hypothetical protein
MSKLVDGCVCQLQAPAGLRPTPEPPVGPPTRQIRPGQTNVWHADPKRHAESFPWHATFTAVPIFFYIFYLRKFFILCRIYVYIHIYGCVKIVYELPLLPNNTASETFLYKSKRCVVLTGYLSLGCRPGLDWANT